MTEIIHAELLAQTRIAAIL